MAAPAGEGRTEGLDIVAGIEAGSSASPAERVEVEVGPARGESRYTAERQSKAGGG